MAEKEKLVPAQETGNESNTEQSFLCDTVAQSLHLFEKLKQRLFNVNKWHEYAGIVTAEFRLCDKEGKEVDRMVEQGDHFKIDIPGPGSSTGDGYDWVRVENIENISREDEEMSLIKVRPATNPTNANKDVAHFFDDSSTSTFMVTRKGDRISAGVYGRNEQPNTSVEGLIDKARNTAVAAAAISVFSKFQWKSLVEGLLNVK